MAYITFKPQDYFNTKLYTGTGATGQAQTGVGFQPDMTWIKCRSNTQNHMLQDAVRTATKQSFPNLTNAETSWTNGLTSFDSDGFTVAGSDEGGASSKTYVAWNWKANGAGSSNSDGSITSTVSADTTSGFSIVKWTGSGANATIGHGLGATPQTIFVKSLADAENWCIYHKNIGNTASLFLNTSSASSANTKFWNNTSPTSTTFSVGNGGEVNGSGDGMIAYCFAEKKGFSKFGKYTGNGDANGSFAYTGFKPAFLLLKQSSGSQGWFLVDNKRANPFNPVDGSLHPNANAAEDTSSDFFVDFTSNGFKLRDSDSQLNGSGSDYIYMSFSEEPLVASNDNPATAR